MTEPDGQHAQRSQRAHDAGPEPVEPAGDGTAAQEQPGPSVRESVLEQLGGVPGLIESSIPIDVFVVVNIFAGLRPALYASVGSALLIAAVRLARREPVRHAINGLVGVVVAALIAGTTGRAENFYLPGILAGIGYGLVFAVSVVVRWPLVGVIMSFIEGTGQQVWRADKALRRTYTWLSLLWAGVFFSRAAVQGALYLANRPNWLGLAKIVMGLPLFGLALLITIWRVRAISARTRGSADEHQAPRHATGEAVSSTPTAPAPPRGAAPTPDRAPAAPPRR